MSLKQIAVLAVLVVASPCWGGEPVSGTPGERPTRSTKAAGDDAPTTSLNSRPTTDLVVDVDNRVHTSIPRVPLEKLADGELIAPEDFGGTLVVKFRDEVRARHVNGVLTSLSGADLSAADLIIRRNRLRLEPWIEGDFERLAAVEDKAAAHSGRAQPDLAGIVRVHGLRTRMTTAAREFNALDVVEYVDFERGAEPAMLQDTGACCIQTAAGQSLACANMTLTDCISMNGVFNPDLTCSQAACRGACCYINDQAEQVCVPNMTALDCEAGIGIIDSDGTTPFTFQGLGSACQPFGLVTCIQRGACCFDDELSGMELCVNFLSVEDCLIALEGNLYAPGVDCDPTGNICDDADCGDDHVGSCYMPTELPESLGGVNSPFCNQQNCCEAVCVILESCCEDNATNPGDWDEACAILALQFMATGNINCPGPPPPPVSVCQKSGQSCFAEGSNAGCSMNECCKAVCFINPDCCNEDSNWNDDCVSAAGLLCFGVPVGPPTPDFSFYQGYLNPLPWPFVDSVLVNALSIPPCNGPGANDTVEVPIFSDFYPGQLIDNGTVPVGSIAAFEGFNIPGLENVSKAIFRLGKGTDSDGDGVPDESEGQNVRVGVVDQSAYIQGGPSMGVHEDLAGRVTIVPSSATLLPLPITDPDHGTAILGIIGANPFNNRGMIGMAPRSSLFFFPAVTLQEGGRIPSAVVDAIETFNPGDVLYIALEGSGSPPGSLPTQGCDTFLDNPAQQILVTMAIDSGVIVVIPAGNDACEVSNAPEPRAIMVGAVSPWAPHTRTPASNHVGPQVAGWGANVATLGYGELYDGEFGDNSGFDPLGTDLRPDPLGLDHTDDYTLRFAFTSAAGAQIAALTARLQGISKQFYQMPLSPDQFITGVGGVSNRHVYHPDFLLDDENVRGADPGLECFGDVDPQEEPNFAGGWPEAATCAAWIIAGTHFGQGLANLQGLMVLRGNHIFGSYYALGSSDDNYVIVESEYTNRDQSGPLDDRAAASVRYLASGQMTDIIVDINAGNQGMVSELTVIHEVATTVNPLTDTNLLIVELYDWTARKWDFVAFDTTTAEDVRREGSPLFNFQRFIRSTDQMVKVRLYTIGLGGRNSTSSTGGGATPYVTRFDFVDLDVGQVTPPGGQTPGEISE